MAAPRTYHLTLVALFLVMLASPSAAQVGGPGWSGGGAIKRTDTASSPGVWSWQVRDFLSMPRWLAPSWLPGRSPIGGSFGSYALRPERRTWLWSRLP